MIALLLSLGVVDLRLGFRQIHVDVMEHHHYVQDGREVYSQLIYYRTDPVDGKKRSYSFSLMNHDGKLYRVRGGAKYVTSFGNCPVVIHAPVFVESWSSDDPEVKAKAAWCGEAVTVRDEVK